MGTLELSARLSEFLVEKGVYDADASLYQHRYEKDNCAITLGLCRGRSPDPKALFEVSVTYYDDTGASSFSVLQLGETGLWNKLHADFEGLEGAFVACETPVGLRMMVQQRYRALLSDICNDIKLSESYA